MLSKESIRVQRFFKNKDGHIVLFQWPNFLLWSWIFLKLLAYLLPNGSWHVGAEQLSRAVLFAWAYLEITTGVNYFRRLFGLLVIMYIVVSYF